jgi:hypothetical protein
MGDVDGAIQDYNEALRLSRGSPARKQASAQA